METQLILDSIDKYDYVESNHILDNLFSKFEKFHFDDFLYFENPLTDKYSKMHKLFKDIDSEVYSKRHLDKDSKEYMEFWVGIFKSGFYYFEKGIFNRDLVSFILFFRTNLFLKVDIDYLIKNSCYNSQFNSLLWNLAFELGKMDMSKMDLEIPENKHNLEIWKSIFSSQNLELLNGTYGSINLKEITDLTKAPSFFISDLILKLVSFLKKYDFALFERTILKLDNMLSTTLFVKSCSFEDIENIYTENVVTNGLLLFCFLKKILDGEYDDIKKYVVIVNRILIQIFNSNKKLFFKLMSIFNTNLLFNEAMGSFICDLSKHDIQLIVDEFPIGWFSQKKDYRRKILESINSESENYIFLLILLYEKRRCYLSNCLINDKISLILNNTLTDLCSCDLNYYLKLFDDEEIIPKLIEILNFIKFLDSEWCYSKVDYKNKFYVYYSDLLILSFAYKYRNLNDGEIMDLFKDVMYDDFIKEIIHDDDIGSLKTIEENLFGIS